MELDFISMGIGIFIGFLLVIMAFIVKKNSIKNKRRKNK